MQLQDKVALITGAGSGIGAAVARRFVEDGAKICIVGRRENKLVETAEGLPSDKVKIFPGDINKDEDIEKMVEATVQWGGKIDALVNCAGINVEGGVVNVDLDDWNRILRTNFLAPFMLMRATIPHMIKQNKGSIINIASIGGLRCLQERVGYCTSKAALIMLTKQAAVDYGQYNIRCNAVCPGFVLTEMTKAHFGEAPANVFRNMPLRRGAEPHEISGICSYLASDDSGYMTGSVITIDAGNTVVDAFEASMK